MIEKVNRKFLEIKSLSKLKEAVKPDESYNLYLTSTKDFQLSKFLYKQIGKKYCWIDRLAWSDNQWLDYINNKNLLTYILKNNEDIMGYFELILHKNKKEVEITYFGILEEYFGKKLGGYLLTKAIKTSFSFGVNRVWVHTCSLDHKNALNNYLSRGMTIFKSESIKL